MSDPSLIHGIHDRAEAAHTRLDAVEQVTGEMIVQVREGTLARTDATPKTLFTLPATARLFYLSLYTDTAPNATTATIKVGKTGFPAFFFQAGVTTFTGLAIPALLTNLGAVGPSPLPVLGVYSETGTPSTLGGPWRITALFFVP